ncbi:hypothetical protein [Oceaniradius stylonematis]|uniref:hypothetical protein n=1 Tax=Oceaniradius stylonematis TaxID=2184161 RepID=UPI00273E858B|nr:hypothetical protein [Oceaniradius stylonematis]
MADEMTFDEIRERLEELCRDGNEHTAHASLDIKRSGFSACFYPDGVVANGGGTFAHGDTAQETLDELQRKWAKKRDDRHAQAVKKAALEIIRLTHEFGECTDAALRQEVGSMTPEMVSEAIALADEMADGGPFKVVSVRGANAA